MTKPSPSFEVRLAQNDAEIEMAQRLRYDVFVTELGGDGPMVDHTRKIEQDAFDPFFDHLLLLDHARDGDPVVGVYRLLPSDKMPAIGRYYSEDEYDLSVLKASGRRVLELGRSCVHPDYRGGTAMFHLWNGLADYVAWCGIEVMFGVASFHGTDVQALAQPLSYLHQNHLASPDLRVTAKTEHAHRMDVLPPEEIDRKAAMVQTPSLIKAYLRLGGFVGEGAFIDHAFNTTDVCLIMDTETMNAKHRAYFEKRAKT
ncbi:MAG: GNAT family N-acetyltransferase [Planktomarina sp.]